VFEDHLRSVVLPTAPGVCNDRRPAPGPTLEAVYSDDTPAFDRLLAGLRARRDLAAHRATDAGLGELAEFGTVEITVAELDQLLAKIDDLDTQLMTHEFVAGQHLKQTRVTAAMIEDLEQAVAGQDGPLADAIIGILEARTRRKGR